MSASERFSRIVSLVATLTRREQESDASVPIADVAREHGVSPDDIAADIRALTVLGDDSDSEWLLSLQVWQQGDRVAISSRGPFRRPVRLSPEEQLAVQVALAMDGEGEALAKRLAGLWSGAASPQLPEATTTESTANVIRNAIHERRALEIGYAGEADTGVRTRVIHPYQMAEVGVRTYIVAYATDVGGWRHFRLDRVLGVHATREIFEPRSDFAPIQSGRDVFASRDRVDRVTVQFRAAAAPWATEYFTEHQVLTDGSVAVCIPASSAEWLTRRVLEFGTDAVVTDPPAYRDALRRAVA